MEIKLSDNQIDVLKNAYSDFIKFENIQIKDVLEHHINELLKIKPLSPKQKEKINMFIEEGQDEAENNFDWKTRPRYFETIEKIYNKIVNNDFSFTEDEMYNIRNITDIYSRLGQGQLKVVRDIYSNINNLHIGSFITVADIFDKASKSVGSYLKMKDVDEKYKIAHDMHQVLRHHLAWKRKPEGGSHSDFEKPVFYSQEPKLYIIDDSKIEIKNTHKSKGKLKN